MVRWGIVAGAAFVLACEGANLVTDSSDIRFFEITGVIENAAGDATLYRLECFIDGALVDGRNWIVPTASATLAWDGPALPVGLHHVELRVASQVGAVNLYRARSVVFSDVHVGFAVGNQVVRYPQPDTVLALATGGGFHYTLTIP